MLALRKLANGPGHVALADVPVPEIGPHDLLMKVYATGICGSDLLIQEDRHFYRAPVTLGHEYLRAWSGAWARRCRASPRATRSWPTSRPRPASGWA